MLKTMFLLFAGGLFSISFVPAESVIHAKAGIQKDKPLRKQEEGTPVSKIKRVASSSKNKRKPASTAYSCSESFQDEYSPGYVQVGYGCEKGANLCLALYRIERNRCEGDHLIRFYCDPEVERLFTFEKIKCKKGCSFQGLSSACVK